MRTILISEILHTIISHRSEGKPLTLEAGIVRVADAHGKGMPPWKALDDAGTNHCGCGGTGLACKKMALLQQSQR